MNRSTNSASARLFHSRPLSRLAVALFALLMGVSRTEAAIEPREILKTYFETGDVPTQEQFYNLIDSAIHLSEDRYLIGLRSASDGGAALLHEGGVVDELLGFGPAAGLSAEWGGQLGFAALAFTENFQTHYGYLQIRAGDPGTSDLYPMFVAYFVYETQPDTAITISSVPEPSSFLLAGICGLLGACGLMRRRALRASEKRS